MIKVALGLLVICFSVLTFYYIKSNTRVWDDSFATGTHIILSPVNKNDITENDIINDDKLDIISNWLKYKVADSDKYLLMPLPGRKVLIQLPQKKYKLINRSQFEGTGVDWHNFSENMIQNNYAVRTNDGEIALTTKIALTVPEIIDDNFRALLEIIKSDIRPSLLDSIPSLEIKRVSEVVPLGAEEPAFEAGTVDRKEHDGNVYFLFPAPELTTQHIDHAYITYSSFTGKPGVGIQMNKAGTDIFARLTQENIDKPLAILYDDIILTAPNIHEPVLEGNTQITGGDYEASEVESMVQMLNTSALLASYEVSEIEPLSKELWAGKK